MLVIQSTCYQFVFVLTLLILAGANVMEHSGRIVGGADSDILIAPYLVSIRYKNNLTAPYVHRCTGVIYNQYIILTTATCASGVIIQQMQIIAGTNYRTQNIGSIYRVAEIIVHSAYDKWFMDNDLALLRLSTELDDTSWFIKPISISGTLPVISGNTINATTAGWGATHTVIESEILQMATVRLVDTKLCRNSYGIARITDAMICAGGFNGATFSDACIGDSGGPLVLRNKVIGLVSWGSGCGKPEFPGVYTNLVYFKAWIEQQAELIA